MPLETCGGVQVGGGFGTQTSGLLALTSLSELHTRLGLKEPGISPVQEHTPELLDLGKSPAVFTVQLVNVYEKLEHGGKVATTAAPSAFRLGLLNS